MVSIFYERGVRKIEDVYIDFKNGQGPYISDTQLNQLQRLIKQEIKEKMELSFPIGKTYVTQTDTNPSTILGFGTWERVKGKVLVGLDEDDADGYFNVIGKEGGEKKHTQTIDELATHGHSYARNQLWYGEPGTIGSTLGDTTTANAQYLNATTTNSGGGQPMNVTQPYKVVGYMWIRTA